MPRRLTVALTLLTAVVGTGTWLATAALAPTRETWDSPIWLLGALPTLALTVGIVSYVAPSRAWRWAVAATAGHALGFLGEAVGSGSSWNLLPFTIVAWVVIALPLLLAARAGARLSLRRRGARH
jgi:hypothetical protein